MVVGKVLNWLREWGRMQVELSSAHVETTLMSLGSSGERGAGDRGTSIAEPVDAMRG